MRLFWHGTHINLQTQSKYEQKERENKKEIFIGLGSQTCQRNTGLCRELFCSCTIKGQSVSRLMRMDIQPSSKYPILCPTEHLKVIKLMEIYKKVLGKTSKFIEKKTEKDAAV